MAPTYPPNFVFLAPVGAEILGGATSAPPSTGRSTGNPSTARVKKRVKSFYLSKQLTVFLECL